MSARQDTFKEYVLDQLAGLPDCCCRPMFGGFGLYQGTVFFAILHKGRLYLKVTGNCVRLYKAHGMRPFRPSPKQTLKSYYEVPPDVLEDAATLRTWADQAIEHARRTPSHRPVGVRIPLSGR